MWAVIDNGQLQVHDAPLPELSDMQRIVGGFIEGALRWPLSGGKYAALYVNDAGKIIEMRSNFYLYELDDVIVGPAVLVGVDLYGETVPLTREEMNTFNLVPMPHGDFPELVIGGGKETVTI